MQDRALDLSRSGLRQDCQIVRSITIVWLIAGGDNVKSILTLII